jgi:hypothetical protein
MNHEGLVQLMQSHQDAIATGHELLMTHETILSVLRGLHQGEVSRGQAIRLLTYQALLAEAPSEVALYRQAAAAIRRLPREER